MPVDSNIPFQFQTPDILGSVDRGLRMSDMIQKRVKDNQRQSAISQYGQNPNQAIKALYQIGDVESAMALEGHQAKKAEAVRLADERERQFIAQNVYGINKSKDPNKAWSDAVNRAAQDGHDVSGLMKNGQVMPYSEDLYNGIIRSSFSPKELQDLEIQQANLAKTKADTWKTNQEAAKIGMESKQSISQTPGQKKVDLEFADDYNKFTGGGQQRAINSINKLEKYVNILKSESENPWYKGGQAGGGPFSGSMPDMARTQESIKIRDDIQSESLNAVKELLAGSTTDADRMAVAASFYNDKLDSSKNADLLAGKVQELKDRLLVQNAKAKYYEQYGTLQGFRGEVQTPLKDTSLVDNATKVDIPKWSKGKL